VFRVDLTVRPRAGVRDPQGEAVDEALKGLGFAGHKVHSVGRVLRLDVAADTSEKARVQVEEMCKRLLVNPNLETYEIEVEKL
jgi:phosphoribosylformylglycinamidine synthase